MTRQLESHYRDVQDVEFTIEDERLFILQTRNAKRTPLAAVKTAVDMTNEGMISREEALRRVDPEEIVQLLVPQFRIDMTSEQVQDTLIARGAGASPGGATGQVYLDADNAVAAAAKGVPVILVRPETKPDDIHGIAAAVGVVTARGGVTSHAAVVTRGLGKPCIVGCDALQVDMEQRLLAVDGRTIQEGEEISIDGTTGDVYYGRLETVRPKLEELVDANTLLGWADQTRKLGVMANADTPVDAAQALSMGAEGIGLCRTEHMFLDPKRLPAVREILLNAEAYQVWSRSVAAEPDESAKAADPPTAVAEFSAALDQVRQLQTQDFMEMLRVMGRRPVIIRLLDAPLHEFLPNYETLLIELAELRAKGENPGELQDKEDFLRQVDSLREANPMLGHRGCRLGLSFPAIYRMQVEAIITACAGLLRQGLEVRPEIMIPLTAHVNEMKRLREDLDGVAARVQKELGVEVPYKFGTMIETPRAAMTAADIAQESEFFSFGTNDLTQMTYGFSRDDAEGKFLRSYVQEGILPADPFETIDTEGVGGACADSSRGRAAGPPGSGNRYLWGARR